jgi:excisionase family DNA binding protein
MIPVREVARRLSVCSETVRRQLRTGELPGKKIGRDWRVNPDEIVLALSNQPLSKPKDA